MEVTGGVTPSVRIELSAPAPALTQALRGTGGSPDRLYVDLANTRLGAVPERVAGGGRLVAVRTGQFRPTVARVVLDLVGPSPYTIRTEGAVVTVTLEERSAAPAASATPRPAEGDRGPLASAARETNAAPAAREDPTRPLGASDVRSSGWLASRITARSAGLRPGYVLEFRPSEHPTSWSEALGDRVKLRSLSRLSIVSNGPSEAYLQWSLPDRTRWLTGATLKAGTFLTPLGLGILDTYTAPGTSLPWRVGVPPTLAGLLLTSALSSRLSLTGGAAWAWNPAGRTMSGAMGLGNVSYTSESGYVTVAANVLGEPAPAGTTVEVGDLLVSVYGIPHTTLLLDSDMGETSGSSGARWLDTAAVASIAISDRTWIAARGEWVTDRTSSAAGDRWVASFTASRWFGSRLRGRFQLRSAPYVDAVGPGAGGWWAEHDILEAGIDWFPD